MMDRESQRRFILVVLLCVSEAAWSIVFDFGFIKTLIRCDREIIVKPRSFFDLFA